jgi:hypothetical protein
MVGDRALLRGRAGHAPLCRGSHPCRRHRPGRGVPALPRRARRELQPGADARDRRRRRQHERLDQDQACRGRCRAWSELCRVLDDLSARRTVQATETPCDETRHRADDADCPWQVASRRSIAARHVPRPNEDHERTLRSAGCCNPKLPVNCRWVCLVETATSHQPWRTEAPAVRK